MNELHLRLRGKDGEIVGYMFIGSADDEYVMNGIQLPNPLYDGERCITYKDAGHNNIYADIPDYYSFDLGIEHDGHVYYDGDKAICISNATYDGCHWPDGNYHVGFIRYDAERMAWGISGDVDGSIDDLFSEMSGEIIVIDTGSAGNYAPKEVKLL